jgi:hypothetical protein
MASIEAVHGHQNIDNHKQTDTLMKQLPKSMSQTRGWLIRLLKEPAMCVTGAAITFTLQ